ncbi:uncharacterized protein LOC130966135 [Arachis stenosperma]|uniref:uncharacterized protein LOC130966135 n=1 Tax=Arachis stenosperma TaxID=217475 RepID=UPI0025AD11F2|nr:uncharacterized protein LOC130966135 [Arachis stenosperma]
MAENTRMKTMEAELKRLSQMIETVAEENRAERTRAQEATNLKFETIQSSLTQLLSDRSRQHSISHESPLGSNSGVDNYSRPWSQPRRVSFDLPKFDGNDALSWIFSADQYFEFFRVPPEEQIGLAAMHMTGSAIPWFQMSQRSAQFRSWTQLKRAIELEFGPSLFESPRELLFKLQQQGSVSDFYVEFVALANRTHIEPADALRDCFISGLRADIRREVKSQCPPSLMRAVSLARLYEDKFSTSPRNAPGPATSKSPSHDSSTPVRTFQRNSLPPLLPTPSQKPSLPPPRNPIRHLSPAEIQSKREKGLCYWCDDKFTAAHKCSNRQFMLMQVENDEVDVVVNSEDIVVSEGENLQQLDAEVIDHHLSYNAMHGASGHSTIRIKAHIGELEIQALIDGGSSDCFIQPRIAKFLNLSIEPAPGVQVVVGNFDIMQVEGRIPLLEVTLQGYKVLVPDVFVLNVAGGDLVIGTTWLKRLRAHIVDYEAAYIRFMHEGSLITVHGEKTNAIAQAEFHHIRRLMHTNSIAEAFTLQLQPHVEVAHSSLTLSDDIHPEVVKLLHSYAGVFAQPSGLPPQRRHDHCIPLIKGADPVKVRPYRYPHSQKAQIEFMVQQMLDDGIIQPSRSPFSSPILLVKKKDGTWRFCTDYRALNNITVKDCFPIPTVDELLDELFGASIFSKLDLRSGYHQILVSPEDRYKTAFRTHQGLYEWLVMPFGLTNAPATFQNLMNDVFRPYLRKFVLVFFDDILVYSPSFTLHLQHLETVLKLLQQECLFAKLSKCSFGTSEIDYLGHTISDSGVHMEKAKVQAIMEWPQPTNVKQLRGFLGLTGYYRRFIRHYASIATLPNFELPFEVETDASGTGVGAVLIQEKHPIAFFSKKLSPSLQKQSAYVREFYAITEAVAKFRHYLLGKKFIIRTDQQSLKALVDQTLHTPEQQKWLHKLLGYDYEIQYKPGQENAVADALSRCFFAAWSRPKAEWMGTLKSEIEADAQLQELWQQCVQNRQVDPHYTVRNGILLWKDRVVLPVNSSLIPLILHEHHDSPGGGHSGIAKTLDRIRSSFYWPNMHKDTRKYVQNCVICQQAKAETTKPAGLLQPLPIPHQVWDDICMDFITSLPPSHGYSVIMVVIDRLTKFAHFIALRRDFDSKTVSDAFIKHIVKLHGFPKSIVSDRDKVFISKFWQQLFHAQGTTLAMSSAYHPQTDGQSEVLNKTLEMYLRCFCFENPKRWLDMLPWAQFWYNSTYHNSIKMPPFKALYGRDPPSLVRYEISAGDELPLQELLLGRDKLIEQLKSTLLRSQQFMKTQADKHRRFIEFEEGDLVLVKLQPYRQHSVALRRSQKLGMRYFGPFPICRKLSSVAYRLELPAEAKIHNVFHISALKKFRGEKQEQYLPLPLRSSEEGPILSPHTIVNRRVILKNGQEVQQLQIQWGQGTGAERTWEDAAEFLQAYPDFNLEDKVEVEERGNVMNKGAVAKRGNIIVGQNDQKRAELVREIGHVEQGSNVQGVRRSSRRRTISRKWENHEQEIIVQELLKLKAHKDLMLLLEIELVLLLISRVVRGKGRGRVVETSRGRDRGRATPASQPAPITIPQSQPTNAPIPPSRPLNTLATPFQSAFITASPSHPLPKPKVFGMRRSRRLKLGIRKATSQPPEHIDLTFD